ncbi:MAG: hypothetical protein OXC31_01185 [Spirochaetaceae bacterium]|nr:hypothetical protein [Spirochaetaceae bacterium]
MTSTKEPASSFGRSTRSSGAQFDQQAPRPERTLRRIIICISVALLSLPTPLAADLDGHYCEKHFDCVQLVDRFLDVFRSGDRTKIVRTIQYPLCRPYPLPNIMGPQQLLERYEKVFDETITALISDSELTDWSSFGWRGIMLEHSSATGHLVTPSCSRSDMGWRGSMPQLGVAWLGYDGHLIALHYASKGEQAEQDRLLLMERGGLHRSLREDHAPILEWITEHYRVRVDYAASGYRYAAWDAEKTHDQEPDLILHGGQLIREGTGGDHRYLFTNGEYRYEVWVNVLGKNSTPIGSLTVFRVDDRGTDSLYVERKEVKGSTLLDEPVLARYRPFSNTDTTHYTTLGEVD